MASYQERMAEIAAKNKKCFDHSGADMSGWDLYFAMKCNAETSRDMTKVMSEAFDAMIPGGSPGAPSSPGVITGRQRASRRA